MFESWQRAASGGDPYLRWGDTVTLDFGTGLNGVLVQRREFARLTLPRPVLCQLNLSVRVQAKTAGAPAVDFTAVDYRAGVGSSSVETRRVFRALPQVPTSTQPRGTPLDVSYQVPLQELQGFVEAQAFDCLVTFTLWIAPIALEDIGGA